MIQRAARAALFDRNAFTAAFFDADATADAVMLVGGVSGVVYLVQALVFAGLSFRLVEGLLAAIISGLASWLFLAVAVWFAGTRLFGGNAHMQTVMRLHGYAVLPLLLGMFPYRAVVIAGVIWYLAALAVATSVALSVSLRDGALSVLVGYAILFIVGLIFRLPFIALGGLL